MPPDDQPSEPTVAGVLPEASPARPMPGAVRAAIAGLLLLAAAQGSIIGIVVSRGGYAITEPVGLALALVILWGVCRGDRLAYLWGRRIGLIGAVLNAIIAVGHVVATTVAAPDLEADLHSALAGVCLAAVVGQLILFVSLGGEEARRYFGLVCPQCGADCGTVADLGLPQGKCDRCEER